MKVGFIGNFRFEFCTETHLSKTLEALGHELVRFQEDKHTAESVAAGVREHAIDLLIWQRTWGLKGDGAKMLRELRCPSVAFHLDLYCGLKRAMPFERAVVEDPWWQCRYVFSADGGSDDFWEAHGVRHFWSPPAVYAPECYLAEPDRAEYPHEVVFVGSRPYHPEWPWRGQLLDWLAATYGSRFGHYGNGGIKSCVRGADLNRLYASAAVVVGDSLCLGFAHENYWSDRIPESLGRGAFLIHPRITGLGAHYVEGQHLACFDYGDFEGLKRTIDRYLDPMHAAERETIRRQGHEHVKAHHTYEHRMRRMLEVIAAAEGPSFPYPPLGALAERAWCDGCPRCAAGETR